MQIQTKQTKYEALKSSAKKYAGLALVASALAFPCYAKAETFPIESATRSNVVATQEQAYSNALSNLKSAFNRAIEDRKFTLDEQRSIEKSLKDAKEMRETLPAEYKDLDSLVNQNLRGIDVGTPALQQKLRENGLEVEVEGTASPEIGTTISILNLVGWAIYLICRARRYD